MGNLHIKRLLSGGLITNYYCPSRCRHCLYNCSPSRSRDYIDPHKAEDILHSVRSLGCGSVHVGGGEPLLQPVALGRVIEGMSKAGMGLDYVETNASWFREEDSAVDMLRELRGRGLHTLLVSISPFHNEHIPAAKIKGALRAAEKAKVRVIPWVEDLWRDLSAFDPDRPHSLQEYREVFGRDYPLQVLRRYWVHFGGRALETFRPLLAGKEPERILAESRDCSRDLLSTGHFHLDLYENYIPGLCAGLAIDVQDLGHPLTEEKYPLLSILFREGVKGLYQLAERQWGYSPQKESYLNACDLCTEIRGFLVCSGYSASRELQPGEFYLPQNMAAAPLHQRDGPEI